MKIGIDARLFHETGVGRYIRNLIHELSRADTQNQYVIFLRKKDFYDFKIPGRNWSKRLADVRWHSFAEQIVMPWLLWKEHCDVIHIPYFNVPLMYFGRFIVTIHDLTILHADTGRASTLPYWMYKIRRLGYRLVLSAAIFRASYIITVSGTVKQDIMRNFGTDPTKIRVTYEGIDSSFPTGSQKSGKPHVTLPYFLYVGNVFPHKNIEVLLEAYHQYILSEKKPASLVFVGPDNYFYRKLKTVVEVTEFRGHVSFLHRVDDLALQSLYGNALALLFPSRMEGFGLPALEALTMGCRVIASDIPVFREILKDCAVLVDTRNPRSLALAMGQMAKIPYDREAFRKKVIPYISRYSWKTMAGETLRLYGDFGNHS